MPAKDDSPAPDLDSLRAEVSRLTAALAALGASATAGAEAQAERIKTASAAAVEGAEDWARAHPAQAMATAGALGFALGLLIGGRR